MSQQMQRSGGSVPGRGTFEHKGFEVGTDLACWSNGGRQEWLEHDFVRYTVVGEE